MRPAPVLVRDDEDDGGARFASIDFRAGRRISMQRLRETQPPPPAYLKVLVPATAPID